VEDDLPPTDKGIGLARRSTWHLTNVQVVTILSIPPIRTTPVPRSLQALRTARIDRPPPRCRRAIIPAQSARACTREPAKCAAS
jgi:hypothetical protein